MITFPIADFKDYYSGFLGLNGAGIEEPELVEALSFRPV
jgi:hypothetical protein